MKKTRPSRRKVRKKKQKRKQGKSKPRDRWVYARTDGVVSEIEMRVDPFTGDVFFVTPVKNTYSEETYNRPSKNPKVVTRTPLPGPRLQVSPEQALRANYDHFLAVDTNTAMVGDQKVSVTAIVLCTPATDPSDGAPAVAYRVPYWLEFIDVDEGEDPERVGWAMALRQLGDDGLLPTGRVAMIVDSDLSAHASINAREEPICEGLYLPAGMALVYASYKVASGSLAGTMIRTADRAARHILRLRAEGAVPPNRDYYAGFPFKAFRILRNDRANRSAHPAAVV